MRHRETKSTFDGSSHLRIKRSSRFSGKNKQNYPNLITSSTRKHPRVKKKTFSLFFIDKTSALLSSFFFFIHFELLLIFFCCFHATARVTAYGINVKKPIFVTFNANDLHAISVRSETARSMHRDENTYSYMLKLKNKIKCNNKYFNATNSGRRSIDKYKNRLRSHQCELKW